jgi:hypothetical protein
MDEEDGFSASPPRRSKALLDFASQHLVLLATIVSGLIFAIRCVAVTEGDPYTASILFSGFAL